MWTNDPPPIISYYHVKYITLPWGFHSHGGNPQFSSIVSDGIFQPSSYAGWAVSKDEQVMDRNTWLIKDITI